MLKRSKRIFIGIPLPNEVKKGITHIKKGYPDFNGVKWTKEENLHLTLVFVGNVDVEIVEDLKNELLTLEEKIPAFTLTFNALQIIKKNRIPVMFWAVYEKNKAYNNLHGLLFNMINKFLKLREEHKDLIPHLTMARIKLKEKNLPMLAEDVQLPDIVVDKIVLWESILLPEGPEYKILQEVNLN